MRPLAGLALVLALVAAAWWWLSRPVERPNILLVTIDSLRADHLGTYGYARATSPTLDRLAAGGVVFEQALSQATLSGPSHATIMTSLDVPLHRVISNAIELEDNQLTLAEVLSASGYATAMLVSHPLVSDMYGFDQGFDVEANFTVHSHGPDHDHEDDVEERLPIDAVFDAALDWLSMARDEPFFLWLHSQHVHGSYEPPPPFDRRFGAPPEESEHDLRCHDTLRDHRDGDIDLSAEEREYVVSQYDGEVAYVDDRLGLILQKLAATDQLKNTIVAVTADHGEILFDDPEERLTGHGRYRSDIVLRVPLILHGPLDASPGTRVDEMVGLIDVAPTILDLAGISRPSSFRGSTLKPLWQGSAEKVRDTNYTCTFHSDGNVRMSARTVHDKITCDKHEEDWSCSYFDLRSDPDELRDLWGDAERADDAQAALQGLQDWFRTMTSQSKLLELRPPGKKARELLRRAGYLEDDE